jgi:hypothetical protein
MVEQNPPAIVQKMRTLYRLASEDGRQAWRDDKEGELKRLAAAVGLPDITARTILFRGLNDRATPIRFGQRKTA